jgi:hypothetical protein
MGRNDFQLVSPEPAEHEVQVQCVAMFEVLLLPDVAWTAIDHAHSIDRRIGRNGVPIGLLEMHRRKKRGIKSGIWDIFLWHRSLTHVIELKVGDNDLTLDQENFGNQLLAAGVTNLRVCWTFEQVKRTIIEWGLTRVVSEAA